MKKTVAIVSRVLSIALLLSFVNNVSADEVAMLKAPRDDAQTGAVIGCCTCSGEDNLECEILKEAKLIETKVDQLQSSLDECCEELNSKLDELQSTQDACCEELHGDFVETWTVLGDPNETIAQSTLDTVLDVNETTTMNIIEWLKLIYNKVK